MEFLRTIPAKVARIDNNPSSSLVKYPFNLLMACITPFKIKINYINTYNFTNISPS